MRLDMFGACIESITKVALSVRDLDAEKAEGNDKDENESVIVNPYELTMQKAQTPVESEAADEGCVCAQTKEVQAEPAEDIGLIVEAAVKESESTLANQLDSIKGNWVNDCANNNQVRSLEFEKFISDQLSLADRASNDYARCNDIISDLVHAIEFYDFGLYQSWRLLKLFKLLRMRRRMAKDVIELRSVLNNPILSLGRFSLSSWFDGKRNRKYGAKAVSDLPGAFGVKESSGYIPAKGLPQINEHLNWLMDESIWSKYGK